MKSSDASKCPTLIRTLTQTGLPGPKVNRVEGEKLKVQQNQVSMGENSPDPKQPNMSITKELHTLYSFAEEGRYNSCLPCTSLCYQLWCCWTVLCPLQTNPFLLALEPLRINFCCSEKKSDFLWCYYPGALLLTQRQAEDGWLCHTHTFPHSLRSPLLVPSSSLDSVLSTVLYLPASISQEDRPLTPCWQEFISASPLGADLTPSIGLHMVGTGQSPSFVH